ncbi:hypothetical protein [Paenibacillus pini]|uniref:Thioredoxin domain-containing protein n=1 Tax=Paenibacillus pini JCM 16418 TaxID=1236976 RepID=W7YUN1_9BACL|nr:hypothetical protein [Paenibacillus pini]GAF06149.1 hypothetical protein JCM16418_94 [Paenibacillus pini JCM 16418]
MQGMNEYKEVVDFKGNKIEFPSNQVQLFLFVSLYCNHCVEFLPQINVLRSKVPNIQLVLFCNGDEEEHQDLSDYFHWDFPIVFIEPENATLTYDIETFPYMILIKQHQKVFATSLTEWEKYEELLIAECAV